MWAQLVRVTKSLDEANLKLQEREQLMNMLLSRHIERAPPTPQPSPTPHNISTNGQLEWSMVMRCYCVLVQVAHRRRRAAYGAHWQRPILIICTRMCHHGHTQRRRHRRHRDFTGNAALRRTPTEHDRPMISLLL